MHDLSGIRDSLIRQSVWHGDLKAAERVLEEHPALAAGDIWTAALTGDARSVGQFLVSDPTLATKTSPPLNWDALTHLCFSKFLRLHEEKADGFVRAAKALLDAGASAATGFWEPDHRPNPEWESALYGAAGVAQNAELTRLLLAHGADPNDEETPYHAPETYNNAALRVLLESGKLNADSLATMLLRKADWHDFDGMQLLLQQGADPNRMTRWHHTALHQAIRRDNHLKNITLLLDSGADPRLPNSLDGKNAIALAAWRGREDILTLLSNRGFEWQLNGFDQFIAHCAAEIADGSRYTAELAAYGGTLLSNFAGNANSRGLQLLLDSGVPVDAPNVEGDAYFGIAKRSTALHAASWRASHNAVQLLLQRGANVNAVDGNGHTPLALAIRACTDSYWMNRRSTESIRHLVSAGASLQGISIPCGYPAADDLLRSPSPAT